MARRRRTKSATGKSWLGFPIIILLWAALAFTMFYIHIVPAVDENYYRATPDESKSEICDTLSNNSILNQPFSYDKGIRGISVVLHTRDNFIEHGRLELTILDAQTQNVLRQATVSLSNISENTALDFVFPRALPATPGAQYLIEIVPMDLAPGTIFSLFLASGENFSAEASTINSVAQDAPLGITVLGTFDGLPVFYWIFAGAILLLALLIYGLVFVRGLQLHHAFLLIAGSLGALYMAVFLPFATPDESIHFGNAYYHSSFIFDSTQKGLSSYATTKTDVDGNAYFYNLPARKGDDIISDFGTKVFSFRDAVFLQEHFSDYPGTTSQTDASMYMQASAISPIAYLPALLGLTLGRLVGMSAVQLVLFGRLFNFLFYLFLCYFGVKLIPSHKQLLCVTALLPIALQQSVSYSYDTMAMGLTLFCIGYILHLALEKERVSLLDLLILIPCGIGLIFAKGIYFLVLLLCFVIPNNKFQKPHVALLGKIGLCVLALIGFISFYAMSIFGTGDVMSKKFTIDLLFTAPGEALWMFWQTIIAQGDTLFYTLFGKSLGWLDINVSALYAIAFLLLTLYAAIPAQNSPLLTRTMRRLCGFAAFLICFSVLIVSLTWTAHTYYETNQVLWGLQGRYFLPALPLVMLAIPWKQVSKESIGNGALGAAFTLNCMVLLSAFCICFTR